MTESTQSATEPDTGAVASLVAKQQITEVLYRRARAGDRRDVELALSCYHEGATEEHEGFTGSAADFTRNVSMISPGSKAPVTGLWHFISNILIELDGDTAQVESYHIAVVIRDEGSGEVQSFIGGRYLDKFAFRDGRWAITHRDVVFDWSRVQDASATYWDLVGLDPSKLLRGDFGAGDPLYGLLGVERGAPSLRV
jgi:3-phenylpropionate/cinnamic acid dioxygenase small subunit